MHIYDTISFIKSARKIHKNFYDYVDVNYIKSSIKICIICPIHGKFFQTPNNHLNGQGCKKCSFITMSNSKSKGLRNFINCGNLTHNFKYNYSKTFYIKNNVKVCIICPIHGEFWQNPYSHLKGHGCASCQNLLRKNTNTFKIQATVIHNSFYNYSKTEYFNARTKVCIICPTHGEFYQTPDHHLQGKGCAKCRHSIGEDKIYTFLTCHKLNFKSQYRIKECKNIKPLPFDFAVFDNFGKILCLIEFQGAHHYQDIPFGWGNHCKLEDTNFRDNLKRTFVFKMTLDL